MGQCQDDEEHKLQLPELQPESYVALSVGHA